MQEKDWLVEKYLTQEIQRQLYDINLIASENYASLPVRKVMGSVLNNKYAEGYPNKRYYGGCENIDLLEQLAIDRVKQIFSADYANVQPHSGSQANQAVYLAVLKPNDTVLAMSLNAGGHLTHGAKVSLSGKWFNFIHYGLDKNGIIDYQQVEDLAKEYKPKLIIAGASAYSLQIDFKKFKEISELVNSYLMVDIAHYSGLIAGKVYDNPTPYADFITSTTHKTLRGPRGGIILAKEKYAKLIDSAVFPGVQGGPLPQIIAAKAIAFNEALQPSFQKYQQQVCKNALAICDYLKSRNFEIISNTTQSHMLLINLSNKNINGDQAQTLLAKTGITVNKNVIPFDQKPANITSGIRIGTAAITTRGFKVEQSLIIAKHIADLIENYYKEQDIINVISQANKKLCESFTAVVCE